MDINNLKAFIEVADKKSFSRSAETLKLTQPAVSKRIAALESELSAKLFDRVGRSVHLTEAGRVLLPSARQISAELSRIEDVICNLGKETTGNLRIGTTEHVAIHHLPSILKTFRRQYPAVTLELQFANTENTLRAMNEGEHELALCTMASTDKISSTHKLRAVDVWEDELHVITAGDHPLTKESSVNAELLSKCPSIVTPTSTTIRKLVEDALFHHDQRLQVTIEANDFETIRSMTAIGLGWSCLPKDLVDDSVVAIATEDLDLRYRTVLVSHNDRTLSRAARAFIDMLPAKVQ